MIGVSCLYCNHYCYFTEIISGLPFTVYKNGLERLLKCVIFGTIKQICSCKFCYYFNKLSVIGNTWHFQMTNRHDKVKISWWWARCWIFVQNTIGEKLEVALTWVCFVVCASPFRVFNQEFNIFLINSGIFGDTFDGEFLDSENKH